jgi:DNA modification methylase
MCVTSPPYWGLRDYGIPGQLGLEKTPEEYIEKLVEIFREVRRVLRPWGTVWLNLGDSYYGSWGNSGNRPELDGKPSAQRSKDTTYFKRGGWDDRRERPASSYGHASLKPKDLCMIPARVALALQADKWWLRSDIIWAKPNPMPESVTDRPTSSYEHIFLLTKSAKYFYDAEAVKNPSKRAGDIPGGGYSKKGLAPGVAGGYVQGKVPSHANLRNVWTINT